MRDSTATPLPSPWRFALGRLARHKLLLGLALFWSAIFVLVPMQVPVITGALIDGLRQKEVGLYGVQFKPGSRLRGVQMAALALVGVAVLRGASAYLRQRSTNSWTRRFVRGIRQSLLARLTTMPLEQHSKVGSGQLFHGALADIENLRGFVGQVVVGNATNALRFVCPVMLMLLHQAWLTAVCCAVIPLQWVITTLLHRQTRAARRQARQTRAKFSTVVKEQLDGAETIQCLGASEAAMQRALRKAKRLEREELTQADCEARKSGVIWLMTSFGFALAWLLGGMRVLEDRMTAGELVAFVGLLAFAFAPFRRFASTMGTSRRILASLAHVEELIRLPAGPVERPDARPLVAKDGRIELRDICFAFGPRPVLQDAQLIIEPNRITALAGRSGSGKTTLLRLINRVHDPQSGQVLIDGMDVREFTVASLRSAVVLVPQRPMVFSGSIAHNLRLAKPEAEEAELLEACEAADLLRFVSRLELGLRTRLGHRGIQLSGGEAQRLAVARAVLMRSKVLLLDEPTSSLDVLSQATIMDTLAHLKSQMTIVVAGHRLEAMRQADHLVVLDHGRIVEQGPPAELLSLPALYQFAPPDGEEERAARAMVAPIVVERV
jgi:ABC-type multidrug transport system fused ATPase/permease subunit